MSLVNTIPVVSGSGLWWNDTATSLPKLLPFSRASIAISGSGNNTAITPSSGKKILVVGGYLMANGTVNLKFQSAAGGTDLTGLAYLVANAGFVLPFSPAGWFMTTTADHLLNINLSAAIAVGGVLVYVEV